MFRTSTSQVEFLFFLFRTTPLCFELQTQNNLPVFAVKERIKQHAGNIGHAFLQESLASMQYNFKDLVPIPVRQEPKRKQNPANKPPSLELTSQDSLSFIKEKHDVEKAKEEKKAAKDLKAKQELAEAKGLLKKQRVNGGKGKGEGKSSERSGGSVSKGVKRVKAVGTSAPKRTKYPTRANTPSIEKQVDKSIVCGVCKHYWGDPEEPDEWLKCRGCQAQYHEICAFATKRCTVATCSTLFRPV
jgi:hypothetical protein